jgi:pectate lyase
MKVYPYRLISDRTHGLSSDARSNSLVVAFMALIQLLLGCNPIDAAALRAFPGAEGFGANALGGRGGRVIEVTNLNDSSSGSLRNCIIASGPRTCVFRTGGTITLNSQLLITNPNLTIAGQTAPGGGIALRSAPTYSKTLLMVAAPNVIIRHIRVRPGKPNAGLPVSSQQALQIGNDNSEVYNVILDHVSATWGIDGDM